MSFPRTYSAIREMLPEIALETRTARGIMRKAGLSGAIAGGLRPRTVVDAYVDVNNGSLRYQWFVDLANFTQIRFTSQSSVSVYLWWSPDTSGILAPPSYAAWQSPRVGGTTSLYVATRRDLENPASEDLSWRQIPAERRVPVRFSLADGFGSLAFVAPEAFDGPFSVAVQVL